VLPNLIIIGAGKAGTTSLHYYLDQHPDIYMSYPKEPYFFHREKWREQLGWYESLFPEPVAIRGEASPSYSAYPVIKDVPRRIHELIPDARLIYLVRDPIDRIAAHYSQHLANGKERRSLAEAVESALQRGDDPVNPYLCVSRYATQVEQYLEYFSRDRILVIDNADMLRDRGAVLRDAFRFLEVDETFESPRFNQVLNTQGDQVRFGPVGAKLKGTRLARFVRSRVPREVRTPVTKPLTRLLSERVERPELSRDVRAELIEALKPEADRLRELTGKRFASWSV
jgi:hypothetical protein